MAVAFLLSPGVRGITIYDFHVEAFIPIFYILCFYFYMRSRTKLFVVSYIFLMSTVETVIPIGITLLLGLFVYELFELKSDKTNAQNRKKHIFYIAICAFITVLFFAFYSFSINYLQAAYTNGSYQNMPPSFRVSNFYGSQIKSMFSPPSASYSEPLIVFIIMALVGISILVFGFGTYTLKVPLITLILISPFLFEVLILHNPVFPLPYEEYYAYVIGGAVVAACLGIMKALQKGSLGPVKIFNILLIAILIAGYTIAFAPINSTINPLNWFRQQNSNISAVNEGISLLSRNSTVMAQEFIAAHMYQFKNLELTPNIRMRAFTPNGFTVVNVSFYWFRPDYIVLDNRLADYDTVNNSGFSIYSYMANNYTLYYSKDGLEIYKEKNR